MKVRLLLAGTAVAALLGNAASAGPCTDHIDGVAKKMSAMDAGAGPTNAPAAATFSQGGAAEHPPTAGIGKMTEGMATSPEDVRRQTEGRPTAADEAAGAQRTSATNVAAAGAALARARSLDASGQEAQCMLAAREAESMLFPVKSPAE